MRSVNVMMRRINDAAGSSHMSQTLGEMDLWKRAGVQWRTPPRCLL